MRRLFIDKIENMRDIGGYTISDNKIVKTGKIIRTNLITNFDKDDLEKIKKMGFSTIIDLRSTEEIERKNGVFLNNSDFSYKHIAIKGNGRLPENENEIINTYIEMLEGKQQIREIFKILSATESGVIYYCNAGKDRTGVVTALILKLLGVDNKDIVLDYIASGVFLKEMLNDYAQKINNLDILKIITPKPQTMFDLLDNIKKEYKSIELYLEECGITKEEIEQIKEKYIEVIK